MNRFALALLVLVSTLLNAQSPNKNPNKSEPPILGPHRARGVPKPATTNSNDLLYHGGPILPTASVQAIFWGSSWGTNPGDKITGLDAWYGGEGSTPYAATVDEYTDSAGHQVSSSLTYLGYVKDTTSSPSHPSTSTILGEVCRRISNPQTNGYYPVYIDHPRKGNYCAYHSWGSCGGVEVQFAFFWKLDGDAGCDPGDTSGQRSQGLAALANVSGHELSEAITDPTNPGAWYDASGAENGDKCAWTFGAPLVQFSNGVYWKIQGEWSNAAYTAGTGYPNSSGQKGCLSGL
jgi:hypothetical protein